MYGAGIIELDKDVITLVISDLEEIEFDNYVDTIDEEIYLDD